MFISLKRSLIIIITYSETYELSNLFLLDIDRNVIPLVCLFSGYIYFIILKIFYCSPNIDFSDSYFSFGYSFRIPCITACKMLCGVIINGSPWVNALGRLICIYRVIFQRENFNKCSNYPNTIFTFTITTQ